MASIMAMALHMHTSFQAYREIDRNRGIFWFLFDFFRWEDARHARMETVKQTGRSILSALTDVDWITALGLDVLLSAVGICCWSVVSNADARSMIKCSIFPWLDETEAAGEDTMDHVRDVTDELYGHSMGRAQNALSSAKETVRRGSQDMKRRVYQLQGTIGRSDDDIEREINSGGPTRGRRGRPAKSPIRDMKSGRASQARSASATSAPSRSRSRASVSPVKRNASSRRSSRIRNLSVSRHGSGFRDDDERRILSSTMEVVTADAQAAGLTWGLFAIGGLGMASAAVFGAEEVS